MLEKEIKNKRNRVFKKDGMILSCGINKTTCTLQSSAPMRVIIKWKTGN